MTESNPHIEGRIAGAMWISNVIGPPINYDDDERSQAMYEAAWWGEVNRVSDSLSVRAKRRKDALESGGTYGT